ncbi:MAG: class I SAM-dependent methyltransferase [Chthoniobacterales bacterium]
MASENSDFIKRLLLERIREKGSIAFSEFLKIALYDPEVGYYASGRARVGKHGDFVTNVSVGPVYGLLLARWFAEQFSNASLFSKDAVLVEQGTHDGQLASDVLTELFKIAPQRFWRYWIVEPSAALQKQQAAKLAPFADSLRWFSSIEELPEFSGIHFSNELVDALPFDLVERKNACWHERRVCECEGQFTLRRSAIDPAQHTEAFLKAIDRLPKNPDFPEPYYSEIRPSQSEWLQNLSKKLQRGRILICDYGYSLPMFYAPWRKKGSLQCYAKHSKNEDPFLNLGEQDISAHVDFTALAQDALAADLQVEGYADQYHFLIRAGTEWLRSLEDTASTPETTKYLAAFKTLIHPESMGTQFRYLALSKNLPPVDSLSGFESVARSHEKLALSFC